MLSTRDVYRGDGARAAHELAAEVNALLIAEAELAVDVAAPAVQAPRRGPHHGVVAPHRDACGGAAAERLEQHRAKRGHARGVADLPAVRAAPSVGGAALAEAESVAISRRDLADT